MSDIESAFGVTEQISETAERRGESMGKIAIVTDSNSGITQKEAKELGIRVLPMPFYINGKLFFEDITLTQEVLSETGGRCGYFYFAAFSGRRDRSVG